MSDIFQTIYYLLANRRNNGKTQKEISNESGVAQSRICRLLDSREGVKNIKRLGLETFFKLFPYARIDFGDGETADGDRSVRNCQLNHSQVVTGDGAVANAAPAGESARDLLDRLMSSPDLDAETKVKIYALATSPTRRS